MNSRLRIIELFEDLRVAQRDLRTSKAINAEEFIYSNTLKIHECVSELQGLIDRLESLDCLFGSDCHTLLHLCAKSGNVDVLDFILGRKGLEYNKKNADGETALHLATVVNQDIDNLPVIIKILSRNEIDIKVKNAIGLTTLDYAIYARDESLIKLYLGHSSMTEEFFYQTCDIALKFQHNEGLEFMLGEQVNINAEFFNSHKSVRKLALDAIEHGYISVAAKLYEINPKVLFQDKYALKFINHDNKLKIQEHTAELNILKHSNPPILDVTQARLFFAAKYRKNKQRKRMAVLEQDDDLPDSHEYKSFLRRLRSILDENQYFSTRMQFIVTSKHWLSGDIKIEKGKVSVLFIDSLGGAYNDSWLDSILLNTIRRFHHYFPEAEMFASVERLQRKDFTSCTLFAIDNAVHLFNEDVYLKKASYKGDLYSYMREHMVGSRDVVVDKKIICSFKLITLPLRLIRSMQGLNSKSPEVNTLDYIVKCGIFSRITKAESWEAGAVVNKRNQTMYQSVGKGLDELDGKQINIRIKNKLNSTRHAIIEYMGSVASERVSHDLGRFGVNGINKVLNHDSKKQLISK